MPRARWAIFAVVAVLTLSPLIGGAAAHAPRAASSNATTIIQSPGRITEQDNFTISMHLVNAANINQVFFTFCQLTNGLCYLPIVMNPQPNNWFNGTTNRMSYYHGMLDGIPAGYNITIAYTNGSNTTYPSIPNQFAGLTVSEITATKEWVYEMVVSPQVYGLSGSIHDRTTGAAIVGANVTLSPGNGTSTVSGANGDYSFAGLLNGTYTLSVTKTGYRIDNATVSVAGQTTVANFMISNSNTAPKASSGGWFGNPLVLVGVAVIVIAAVLAAVTAVVLSRRKRPPPTEPMTASENPPSTSPKP